MTRRLSDWLQSFLEFNKYSESPELFHFWSGVSTIGSALRRRVWIDMGKFEWTPNFYIILVAPAGVVSKSTTIGVGERMLRELDGLHFGPDSGTWQAMARSLEDARESVFSEPGNFDSAQESMSCVNLVIGELGTFFDFNDRKLIDVMTSLWDGQRTVFEHKTVTNGTTQIHNPWINMISATTPSWLKSHFPEEAIGGGFASRVIFVFGQKKRHLVAYPGLIGDKSETDALRNDLVHDLREIADIFGEIKLTPEAISWGEDWYEKHWTDRPAHLASDRFDGYLARKQTHIHKLAIVLSTAESNEKFITLEQLTKAEAIATATESDMLKVFESIGVTPTAKLIHEIISFIWNYQEQGLTVHAQALYRHCFRFMTEQEFTEAQNAALKAGYIQMFSGGGDKITYKALVSPEQLGQVD